MATNPRGKSAFGDILSKSRINREVEDVQAQEQEQQAQEVEEAAVDADEEEVSTVANATEDVAPGEQLSAIDEVDAEDTSVQGRNKGRIRADGKTSRRKDNERGSVVSKLERGQEEVLIQKRARARDEQNAQAKVQDKKPKA